MIHCEHIIALGDTFYNNGFDRVEFMADAEVEYNGIHVEGNRITIIGSDNKNNIYCSGSRIIDYSAQDTI